MTRALKMGGAEGRAGMRDVRLDLSPFPMEQLLAGCVQNLVDTYDEASGLFPYTTRLVDGAYVNDYDHPQAVRYTVNTLLGLAAAARHDVAGLEPDDVRAMTDRFLAVADEKLDTTADVGLLAVHLSEGGQDDETLEALVGRLRRALADGAGRHLDLQTLSWTIWGMVAATERGVRDAEALAREAAAVVERWFVDPSSRLPRHSTSWYRRSIVSFGSVTYFLRAAHELGRAFDDERWRSRLRGGVEWALEHQGPKGEWPWLMNTRSGVPVDTYPTFSVHQDSMAMLFLLPVLDAGLSDAGSAIERSLAWCFGDNDLGVDFYRTDPFVAYRSIERAEVLPRLRRYGRSVIHGLTHKPSRYGVGSVHLNDECRSYHLGWILYVWSQRVMPRVT